MKQKSMDDKKKEQDKKSHINGVKKERRKGMMIQNY